jgi:hypothetical protein
MDANVPEWINGRWSDPTPPILSDIQDGDGQNPPLSREENDAESPETVKNTLISAVEAFEPVQKGGARPGAGRPKGCRTKDCRQQHFWFSVIQNSLQKLKPGARIDVAVKILDRMIAGDWAKAVAANPDAIDMDPDLYADLMIGRQDKVPDASRSTQAPEPKPIP